MPTPPLRLQWFRWLQRHGLLKGLFGVGLSAIPGRSRGIRSVDGLVSRCVLLLALVSRSRCCLSCPNRFVLFDSLESFDSVAAALLPSTLFFDHFNGIEKAHRSNGRCISNLLVGKLHTVSPSMTTFARTEPSSGSAFRFL